MSGGEGAEASSSFQRPVMVCDYYASYSATICVIINTELGASCYVGKCRAHGGCVGGALGRQVALLAVASPMYCHPRRPEVLGLRSRGQSISNTFAYHPSTLSKHRVFPPITLNRCNS